MHEIGAVHAAAAGFLQQLAGRPVRQVTLGLGPGVDPEVVASAWRSATAGGPAESAEVIWNAQPNLLSCLGCGLDYRGSKLDRCPACAADGLVIAPAPEVAVLGWTAGEPVSRSPRR